MENFPHLPTLLSVAAAVVLLVFILERYLFRPLNDILETRRRRSEEARRELEEAQATQTARLEEIERRLSEARREAYEIREAGQRAGRERRDAQLEEARQEAQEMLQAAREEIEEELESAKDSLEGEAERLADMIAERLLGRPVSSREEGE